MQFLTPLFLTGLLAIAVPLWFHLIRREHALRIPFSSLMYVPPKEIRLVRRQQLRQWPLFLLRLLLIVVLVLALSRPYWKRFSSAWTSASVARVVLLDNSFSMAAGNRWPTAQSLAEREIKSAPRGSELTLGVVSDRVDVLSEPGELAGALLAKLKQVRPSYRATRLDQGIQIAGDLLKQSRMGNREIVLASDFQKNGLHFSSWNIPEGIGLRALSVPPAGDNLFIEDVQAPAEIYPGAGESQGAAGAGGGAGQSQPDFVVRIQNGGNADFQNVPVELHLDDRVVQSQRVTIPAKSSRSVHFRIPDLQDRTLMRFVASAEVSDALPEDNRFFFTVHRREKIPVVLSAEGPAVLFLREAISSPGAPWELKTDLSAASLKKARVLILHDPASIPGYVSDWVQSGGSLLIFSGARSAESLKSPLLPVTPHGSRILRRERDEPLLLADIQWQHPVFQIFADQQKRYFSGVHFYGYTEAQAAAESKILARLKSDSPALVEKKFGRGNVLWFASTASNDWSDFALRPAFLPFVQNIVAHLSGTRRQFASLRVGDRLDLTLWGGSGVAAIDPRGQRLAVPEDRQILETQQPGFYEVRYNRLTDYVGVNIPAAESNLESEAVQQIQARAQNAQAAAAEVSAASLEHRQSLWRFLLLFLVVVMLGEWVLADLFYGKNSPIAR